MICQVFLITEYGLLALKDPVFTITLLNIFLRIKAAAWYNTNSRKDGGTMDTTNNAVWEAMIPEEKRRALYERQVATPKTFLEHGAISKEQYDKSLHDLTVKMGYKNE